MAESNIVNIAGSSRLDRIKQEAARRYAPEEFTVSDYEETVLLRRLKGIEQDELYRYARDNKEVSNVCYNAMQASLGLVDPPLTYAEALEMPADWVAAVATRINEKTVVAKVEDDKKAADEPAPFIVPSSGTTGSPSPSEKPSEKSKS